MKKCFPFLTTCGSQLEYIDKRHCNLLSVPDEVIRNCRSIEECFLDANQIKDLPKNFFRLSKVKVLTLSDNELLYLPENIGNFIHLIELDVSRNHIDSIHSNIKHCNELRSLDLSNNPINRLPEGFSGLRNLTVLNLNDISLTDLPLDFGNLTVLQKLELRDNCLKSLPNSFSRLECLELLDLGGNEFQEYPKALIKLTELRVLCMDNNELQTLPKEIGTLKNLQQLDVSENFLESIDDGIGHLVLLTDFVLSQNSLDSLPNNIGFLKDLTVLKVDQNKLMSLTSYVGECTNLQELYLTENLLQRLPGTLGKLSKLGHLNVDRNALTAIPTELTRCSQLSIMSFRGNQIRRLPEEIGDMSNLHVLDVSNNLLDRLPVSIANCPLKALWLSENQSQSLVKLQRDHNEQRTEEYLTCYLLPQHGIEDVTVNGDASLLATQSLPFEFRKSVLPPTSDYNPVNAPVDYTNALTSAYSLPMSGSSGTCELSNGAMTTTGQDDDSTDPVVRPVSISSNDAGVKVRFNDDNEPAPLSNRLSKELPKSRHPKLDKRAIDGHIIPKDTHSNKDTKFAPNRVASDSDYTDSRSNGKSASGRTKKTSDSNFIRSDSARESSSNKDNISPLYPAPPSMAPNVSVRLLDPSLSAVPEVKRSHSDAGLPGGDDEQEQVGEKSSHASSSDSGSIQVKQESPSDKLVNRDVIMRLNVNSTNRSGDNAYSSGGEEIDSIARHVGFTEEVEYKDGTDNSEAVDNLKLIRRDTPHYTKKARIQEVTMDGVKNEDVVKQIMEKLKQSNSSVTDSPNSNGGGSGVAMRINSPTSDQVISASALARGSNVPPGLLTATTQSEQVRVVVNRQSDEPLGMSIAGGRGSSPYQPVFISRVAEIGAAHRFGLMVNDRILEVNRQSMVDVDHNTAVSALKNAGYNFELLLLRDVVVAPPPLMSAVGQTDNWSSTEAHQLMGNHEASNNEDVDVKFETIDAEVVRDDNGLGFSIAGGKGSMRKDICDERWAFLESIYICKISPNGAADKCGKLQVGDKIIKINGIDVSDARHNQAVVLLSGLEPSINLEVQRQIIVPRQIAPCPAESSPSDALQSNTNCDISKTDAASSITGGIVNGLREKVRIIKTGSQLGLSICGGSDHYAHPFGGTGTTGIFISKISTNGAAHACGRLRIGDRILSVNGHDVTQATHDEAIVHFLHTSSSSTSNSSNEIILDIIHEPQPAGLRRITITKEINERLGIVIQGGNSSPSINLDDVRDHGVFITKICDGGAVERDGRLRVGDRIIELNNRSFMGISLTSANKVLTEVTTYMDALICDGISPDKISEALKNTARLSLNDPAYNELDSNNVSPTKLKYSPTHNYANRRSPAAAPSPGLSSPSTHIINNNTNMGTTSPSNHSNNISISPITNTKSSSSPSTNTIIGNPNTNNNNSNDNQSDYSSNQKPIDEAQRLINLDREHLSFRSKRKYFENEIKCQKSPPSSSD